MSFPKTELKASLKDRAGGTYVDQMLVCHSWGLSVVCLLCLARSLWVYWVYSKIYIMCSAGMQPARPICVTWFCWLKLGFNLLVLVSIFTEYYKFFWALSAWGSKFPEVSLQVAKWFRLFHDQCRSSGLLFYLSGLKNRHRHFHHLFWIVHLAPFITFRSLLVTTKL